MPQLHQRRERSEKTLIEKAPRVPLRRLRQGLREDLAPPGPPQVAHGGASLRLQLALLRKAVHQVGRAAAPPTNPHGGEEVRLHAVFEAVHEVGSPGKASEDAQKREEVGTRETGSSKRE